MTVKLEFDGINVVNSISGHRHKIDGNFTYINGAVKFDGLTT